MRGGRFFQVLKGLADPSAQIKKAESVFCFFFPTAQDSVNNQLLFQVVTMAGSSRCWLPLMKNKEEKKKTNRIGGIAALQLLKRLARMLQSRLFQQNLTAFLP